MTGIQEILLLLIVLMIIILLSRTGGGRQAYPSSVRISFRGLRIPVKQRLALVLSVFWPLGMAAWLKPWQSDPIQFVYLGVAPVAAVWAGWWVWRGYRK